MPTLPVLTEGGNAFGYPVAVGPHQLTDMEHGTVHESKRCVFHEQLIEHDAHTRQCLVALADERRVAAEVKPTVVVGLCPVVDTLHGTLWGDEATEQQERNDLIGMQYKRPATLRVGSRPW